MCNYAARADCTAKSSGELDSWQTMRAGSCATDDLSASGMDFYDVLEQDPQRWQAPHRQVNRWQAAGDRGMPQYVTQMQPLLDELTARCWPPPAGHTARNVSCSPSKLPRLLQHLSAAIDGMVHTMYKVTTNEEIALMR
jgi:hypothetical protein